MSLALRLPSLSKHISCVLSPVSVVYFLDMIMVTSAPSTPCPLSVRNRPQNLLQSCANLPSVHQFTGLPYPPATATADFVLSSKDQSLITGILSAGSHSLVKETGNAMLIPS